MNRRTLTLLLLFAAVCFIQAKPRTGDQMRSAAAQALNKCSAAKGWTQSAKATEKLEVMKETAQLTVLGYESGGYAVIANDDDFTAVLGYSDTRFSDNLPPAFFWWLETMSESLEQMLANGETMRPVSRASEYKETVENLLTTEWSQSAPYNNLCPTYTNSSGQTESYVTGCVATAMAQILKYHQYPTRGSGSKSYRWTPEDGSTSQTVSAVFRSTTYDYANMLDSYTGTYTDEQAKAVATLMKHCGVSVEMQYTQDGSGAYVSDACTALRKYFSYHPYIKYYNREYFPQEEWMNIVYRELSDGCPILYSGNSTAGGHAFVFCGYDADGKVYVNWGWGGSGNGYFEVASLSGYSSNQEMTIVRLPDDERYNESYSSLWGLHASTPFTLTANENGSVSMSASYVYNFDVDNFTGCIDLVAMNLESGEIQSVGTFVNAQDVEPLEGKILSGTFSLAGLAEGSYRIFIATKSTSPEEDNYQPVRSKERVRNSYTLVVEGGNATLKADNSSNWTAGIETLPAPSAASAAPNSNRIYTISGQYAGTDLAALKRGLYIRNGKKIVKK